MKFLIMNKKKNLLKSIGLAGMLEFFCPGIGFLYAGKLANGLLIMAGTWIASLAWLAAIVLVGRSALQYLNQALNDIHHIRPALNIVTQAAIHNTPFRSTLLLSAIFLVALFIWLLCRMVMAANAAAQANQEIDVQDVLHP